MGRAILDFATAQGINAIGLKRDACDITNPLHLNVLLASHRPDIVINCAAFTAVDAAETQIDAAFAVNRDGASNIALACRSIEAVLIHLSTDYVFGNGGQSARVEADPIGALNVYGASKAAGEAAIERALERHLILRTSWIYGPQSANFFATIMNLAEKRDAVSVVTDEYACPTYAPSLAEVVVGICQMLSQNNNKAEWGILHACGTQAVSRFEFAQKIMNVRASLGLKAAQLSPTTQAAFGAPAHRPNRSHLDCSSLKKAYGYALPSLDDILPTLVREWPSSKTRSSRL
jgi:dTDP-4-dehydrorhamnose reductase